MVYAELPWDACSWGRDTVDCAFARYYSARRSENTSRVSSRGCYTLYSTSPCSDTTPRSLSFPFSPSYGYSILDSSGSRCCSRCGHYLDHGESSRSTFARRICKQSSKVPEAVSFSSFLTNQRSTKNRKKKRKARKMKKLVNPDKTRSQIAVDRTRLKWRQKNDERVATYHDSPSFQFLGEAMVRWIYLEPSIFEPFVVRKPWLMAFVVETAAL